MSREDKRRIEREKRKAEQRTTPVEEEVATAPPGRERTGVAQFVGEVRSELRRVHWPNRRELVSYSLVVIVALTLMTAFIYGMDSVFKALVFEVFG
ncbi:MAG: preprotein translocase subunit SecE [Actinobacteria bacterium QS_5_72_10]|jgi:preprotein translocase subunit SecE|nr:MAG: preprotein translocase subunit SecE [Actinobacteria bacterium QS_8_72_14]PSO50632.1 MAG: preprotein translocase subunit SecE [Actinobacteria bacterium QS_5_72_10]